jgi:hypothetical protein
VIRWWMHLHRWRWKDVRRHLTGPHGRWRRPTADGVELFNIAKVPVTRYRYGGSKRHGVFSARRILAASSAGTTSDAIR